MKRVLSLLLVLAMVISMVPNVFATTGDSSDTDFGGMLEGNVSTDELANLTVSLEEGSEGETIVWLAEAVGTLTVTMDPVEEGKVAYVFVSTDGENWSEDCLPEKESLVVDVVEEQEVYIWVFEEAGQAVDVTIHGEYAAPLGTEENPIDLTSDLLYEGDFSATVTVPAGATYYFNAFRVGGMIMTINGGEGVACTTDGMWYPYAWTITNDGEEDAEYVINVAYPVGVQANPDTATLGDNYCSVEANSQGYYWNYTADYTGDLIITVSGPENWQYVVNNVTAGTYGDTQWSDSDPVVNPTTIAVTEGDLIEIFVVGYDPADMWSTPAADYTVNLAYPAGSVANPIDLTSDLLYEGDFSATVTVPAGATYYFNAFRVGGMIMTINGGEGVVCTTDGMWYPYAWTITNDGEEDAEYVISVAYPAGSYSNPDTATLGDNYCSVEANSQGYYWNYTAEYTGELTITVSGPENWQYVVNNVTAGTYGDTQWSDSDPVVNPTTIAVTEGDLIEIIVVGYDPADMWSTPAADYTVNLAYPAGSVANPIDLTSDLLYEDDFSATVTVPAGATYYFNAFRVGGMVMTINGGEGVVCTTDGIWYPYAWTITNDGEEDAEYVISVAYPAGTYSNPDIAILGDNNCSVEANSQGYYWNYTAEQTGDLIITVSGPENWQYVVNNVTAGTYGDMQWSDSDPVVNPTTIAVTEGDLIEIIVVGYNPADMWSTPAADYTVNLAYRSEPVASVGDVLYTSLQEAVNAGGTVELLANVDTDSAIEVSKAVVLNLNGYTVAATENDTVGDGVFHVVAGGDLTINGEGTINGLGGNPYSMAIWADGGKVTINGGYYTNLGASDPDDSDHFDLIYVKNGGEVVINGGKFECETPAWVLNSHDTLKGTITVYGGEFVGFNPADNNCESPKVSFVAEGYCASEANGIYTVAKAVASADGILYSSLQAAVNAGGTVELLANVDTDSAIEVSNAVVLNLNGYTVAATENDTVGDGVFHVVAGGDLTINGEGTINGLGGNPYSMAIWADGGKVTINGGYYTNLGAIDPDDSDHFDLIYVKNGGEVVINGGKFECETPAWVLNSHDTLKGTITVYGGEFVGFNPADNNCETPKVSFVAEGYCASEANGIYTVAKAVASADGILYSSLQAAVNAGGTVELLANVDTDSAIEVSNAVVLNLNGYTVAATENDTVGDGVFHVVAGGDLTINGEGTINGLGGNPYSMAIWADGGKVTINGGYYTNLGAIDPDDSDHFDLIYVKNGGEVVINGGKFECETPAWVLNSHDTLKGTITVYGGEFVGFNPADNNCETPKVSFVAEGYCASEANGIYTVGEHTVADACVGGTCSACGEYVAPAHTIEYVAAVIPANCQETGHDEYWHCTVCDAYLGDAEGSYQINPMWIYYTGEHVRPEGSAACAVVTCEICGEDSYGSEPCVRDNTPACQNGTCVNCGETVYGEGHSYGYDEDWNPLQPFCQPGTCIHCNEELEKIYDCENGSYAPCSVDGECVHGCGKLYPATGVHAVDDPCAGGLCWQCWNTIEGAHTVVIDEAVPATCTSTGLSEGSHCSVCNEVIVAQEEVAMLEHAWDEGVYTDPTTEANGYTTYTCGSCGETKVEIDEGSQITFGFTKQPESITETVTEGDVITFSVEAAGAAKYQWFRSVRSNGGWSAISDGNSYSGTNTNTLTITAIAENNWYFMCRIYKTETATKGTDSDPVTYTSIYDFKVDGGSPLTGKVLPRRVFELSVNATGYGLKFEWFRSVRTNGGWSSIKNMTNYYTFSSDYHKVSMRATPVLVGFYYECRITDENGEKITVGPFRYDTYPPAAITSQTVSSKTANAGEPVTFTVATDKDGIEDLQYLWVRSIRKDGGWSYVSEADGTVSADGRSFTVSATPNNKWYYSCIVVDAYGNKTEATGMTYTCNYTLNIESCSEATQTAAVGETVNFYVTVAANQQEGVTYQWRRSGRTNGGWSIISGESSPELSVTAIKNNGFYYCCFITDQYGIVTQSIPFTYTAE